MEMWNNLCAMVHKYIKDNKLEKEFQQEMKVFFSSIGWTPFKRNLREQVEIPFAHTKGYADFILGDENNEQIIVELKRPRHTKSASNERQLTDYMKVRLIKFGLYIGEQLDVYYHDNSITNPVLITSIQFDENNHEGDELLKQLAFDSYSEAKFEHYCSDKSQVDLLAKYWSSPEGVEKLMNFIASESNINEGLKKRLSSLISIEIKTNDASVEQLPVPQPSKAKVHNRDKYSIDGKKYYAKRSFMHALVVKYMADHSHTTFAELKKLFPLRSATNETLIREKELRKKSTDAQSRYNPKVLEDCNGMRFYVSTQWTKEVMDSDVAPLVKRLGYVLLTVS